MEDHIRPFAVIIDDNLDGAMILSTCLEEMDIAYIARSSGFAFFKYLEGNPGRHIDLILLDIQIPIENGYEVIARIRKDQRLAGVKVVAVTANDDRLSIERAHGSGFDGFISKPINLLHFPEDIMAVLSGTPIWPLPVSG